VGGAHRLTPGRLQLLYVPLSCTVMPSLPAPPALKNAAYVAIGFGVIGFQKAQVRRRELTKQLEDLIKTVRPH
jgi:hypothetical protein